VQPGENACANGRATTYRAGAGAFA